MSNVYGSQVGLEQHSYLYQTKQNGISGTTQIPTRIKYHHSPVQNNITYGNTNTPHQNTRIYSLGTTHQSKGVIYDTLSYNRMLVTILYKHTPFDAHTRHLLYVSVASYRILCQAPVPRSHTPYEISLFFFYFTPNHLTNFIYFSARIAYIILTHVIYTSCLPL